MNLRGSSHKYLYSFLSILALLAFSFVAYATAGAPPTGGYNPGYALDPGCTPGTTNCIVNISNGSGWSLTGNAGTTAGTAFIGTTDAQDLIVKTDGTQVADFEQSGNLSVTGSVLAPGLAIGSPASVTHTVEINGTFFADKTFTDGTQAIIGSGLNIPFSGLEGVGQAAFNSSVYNASTNPFPNEHSGVYSWNLAGSDVSSEMNSVDDSTNEQAFLETVLVGGVPSIDGSVSNNLSVPGGLTEYNQTQQLLLLHSNDSINSSEVTIDRTDGITLSGTGTGDNVVFSGISNISTGCSELETNGSGQLVCNGASDENLKHDIQPISYGLDTVMQLNPVSFQYNDPSLYGEGNQIGFVAQQVQPLVPEVVYQSGAYLGIDYAKLTAVDTKAIQDLDLKLVDIENLAAASSDTTTFLASLENWLASATNGIVTIVTQTLNAKNVNANQVCLTDSSGQVCVNAAQLRQMMQSNGQTIVVSNPVSTPTPATPPAATTVTADTNDDSSAPASVTSTATTDDSSTVTDDSLPTDTPSATTVSADVTTVPAPSSDTTQ